MKKVFRTLFRWKYRYLIKPILFCFPADQVHELFLSLGRHLGRIVWLRRLVAWLWRYDDASLEQTVAGLRFRNPIGLSAGFDYRADLAALAPAIGFGFASIGTLTLGAYEGNPRPMLDRLPKSRALLVNKGFKNEGITTVLARLTSAPPSGGIRGISIGATNRVYPDFPAMIEEIVAAFRVAEAVPHFDYYELNISCPNLLNLKNLERTLASPDGLEEALRALSPLHLERPVFVKLPLERTEAELASLIDAARPFPFVTGLICANLAKDRSNPAFDYEEIRSAGQGNFSGKPTERKSNALLETAYALAGDRFVLIGVGGVFWGDVAYQKII
ncbi:MAG: hypothetical protein ACEQSB_05730 [Undibacterium sp.]